MKDAGIRLRVGWLVVPVVLILGACDVSVTTGTLDGGRSVDGAHVTPDGPPVTIDLDGGADARPDGSTVDSRDSGGDAGFNPNATPVFVRHWGGLGTEPGQFIEPSSVELDSNGVVIVAGHEDRVQRFTRDGQLIDIFGMRGVGDGQFNHPHGLAVDRLRGDLIYVGDQNNNRLQVFTQAGSFVRRWGDAGFRHIHDVGIDRATGDIFVGDYELHTLRKFSATGELLGTYGGAGRAPGRFQGVWGVSTDSDGFVYVADTFNKRIQKLNRDGGFVAEWTSYAGEPFIKPTGVYVDERDIVYVCDSLAQVIILYSTDGEVMTVWDIEAIYGQRSEPEDVVISPDGRDIYIGEVYGHRVLQLRMP